MQVILGLGLSFLHILFVYIVTIDFYVYNANKIIKSNQRTGCKRQVQWHLTSTILTMQAARLFYHH